MTTLSKFGTLNARDFIRGLFVAALTAAISTIQASIHKGSQGIEWQTVLIATVSATLAYLLKNLVTNSQGQILTT